MDISSFILDQVAKTGRPHRSMPDHVLVQCPIHNGGKESRPSRKINISNPRFKPMESFCWVCHDDQKRIPWNELAAIMGMAPIREDTGEGGDDDLWLQIPPPEDFYGREESGIAQTPWEGRWRGINAKLLKQLEATEVNSRDEPRIYFPVMVDGVEVGNVQCVIDTDYEESSEIKYLLSGKWTQYTLYPIDIAFPMAEKVGFIVIVEGLRDALNLLQHGVPAVCIWGTNGWNAAKRDTITELGVKIVIGMDGDDSGRTCKDKIAGDLKKIGAKFGSIDFTEGEDPGKLKRVDVLEILGMFSKEGKEKRYILRDHIDYFIKYFRKRRG